MTDETQKFFDAVADINLCENELRQLASAFAVTGNLIMSKTLRSLAAKMNEATDVAQEGYIKLIHQRVKDADQSTANMLGMAVAMSALKQ